MSASSESSVGLFRQIADLDSRFWIVNTMEMIERFAYYGVRAVIAIYMVLPVELGGPEFTHIQKGSIFACWAALQSFLPMFTGGLADRFGHKNTISVAIVLKIIGYAFMAMFTSYWGFWLGCMLLATGTAIFKPGVQGTLAATLKDSEASVGWAIFYQLVNVGGFLGPVLAGFLRSQVSWAAVFWACAVLVAVNFMWLPFYKDPTQEPGFQAEDKQKEIWQQVSQVITRSLAMGWLNFLCGASVVGFLIIFVGTGMTEAAWTGEVGDGLWNLGRIRMCALAGAALSAASWGMAYVPAAARASWIPMALAAPTAIFMWLAEAHIYYQAKLPKAWPAPEGVLNAEAPIPFLASFAYAWFYFAAASAMLAFFFLYFLPRKDAYDAGRVDGWSVVIVSGVGVFQHRVLWFCIAFAGFWLMFAQVFDLLPNVIDDWVDSSMVIGALGTAFGTATVPTLLAVFLGIVSAAVASTIILLATRPDRRPAEEVPEEAYAVVAIALFPLALFLPHPSPAMLFAPGLEAHFGGLIGLVEACVVALLGGFAVWRMRIPGKMLAIVNFVVLAPLMVLAMRAWMLGSSDKLVEMAANGEQIPPEWMINLNPGLIVFTVVFFGYLASFVRPLTSILAGMAIATIGSVVAGTAVIGWSCLAGILIFSVGEMLSSPKKMEYLASLAKKGQEGLFMGYANVPVAIGWITGSIIAGNAYEKNGDKVNLARRHLVSLGEREAQIADMPKSEVVPFLAEKLAIDELGVQKLLFELYHPQYLWFTIAGVGVASILLMIVYDRVLHHIDSREETA
jgi:dipeptide/tripeptide permease